MKGETDDDQSSTYIYNAMGVRIGNIQERINVNAAYQNAPMFDGSNLTDYAQYLKDFRDYWQSTWETEVGTTVQNNPETVTKHYVVDYLSMANRDILVTEDGRYTQRYVYDENGKRISAEYDYAENTHRGGSSENFQSDFATQEIEKIWYRTSHLGSTLFTTDTAGEVISHTIYDPWGKPVTETYMDANFSGMDVQNNYTGYTYDEVLDIYFAQFRFYNADDHRFTQEDPIKDGDNWYLYVENSPLIFVDPLGQYLVEIYLDGVKKDSFDSTYHYYPKGTATYSVFIQQYDDIVNTSDRATYGDKYPGRVKMYYELTASNARYEKSILAHYNALGYEAEMVSNSQTIRYYFTSTYPATAAYGNATGSGYNWYCVRMGNGPMKGYVGYIASNYAKINQYS